MADLDNALAYERARLDLMREIAEINAELLERIIAERADEDSDSDVEITELLDKKGFLASKCAENVKRRDECVGRLDTGGLQAYKNSSEPVAAEQREIAALIAKGDAALREVVQTYAAELRQKVKTIKKGRHVMDAYGGSGSLQSGILYNNKS